MKFKQLYEIYNTNTIIYYIKQIQKLKKIDVYNDNSEKPNKIIVKQSYTNTNQTENY